MIHELKPTDKIESAVLSLILAKFFGVKVADVVESKLLHIDSLKRLLNLHHSFGCSIGYDDDHAFKNGVCLVEGTGLRGCLQDTFVGDHGHGLFLDLLKSGL